ncbi:MAG: hypothetical protein AAF514_20080 [Verrucomicrobiota bacterium]
MISRRGFRFLCCFLAGYLVLSACTRRELSEADRVRNALELWLQSQSLVDVVETTGWSGESFSAQAMSNPPGGGSIVIVDEETSYEMWKPHLPLKEWSIGKRKTLEGAQRFEVRLTGGLKENAFFYMTLIRQGEDQAWRLAEVTLPG